MALMQAQATEKAMREASQKANEAMGDAEQRAAAATEQLVSTLQSVKANGKQMRTFPRGGVSFSFFLSFNRSCTHKKDSQ